MIISYHVCPYQSLALEQCVFEASILVKRCWHIPISFITYLQPFVYSLAFQTLDYCVLLLAHVHRLSMALAHNSSGCRPSMEVKKVNPISLLPRMKSTKVQTLGAWRMWHVHDASFSQSFTQKT